MTKGWCPVHDRVFETPDGLCPECGTALVDVQPRPADDGRAVVVPEAEDEPDAAVQSAPVDPATSSAFPIGPATLATVVTAVVVVAFLAGLAFPRGRRSGPATVPTAAPIRADYSVGIAREGADVRMRLESFSQRGGRVVLRVTIPPDAPVGTGRIDVVTVKLVRPGEETAVELTVRPTISGFIAEGALDKPHLPVTEVVVESIRADSGDGRGVDIPLDSAHLKPGLGDAPRTTVLQKATRLGDGRTLRRLTLLAWSDGLEARLDIQGERTGWSYDDALTIRTDRGPFNSESVGPLVPGVHRVLFPAVDAGARPTLSIFPRTVTVFGNWHWTLPSGA